MKRLHACIRFIDALNEKAGRAVSWLTLAMVLLTAGEAVARYAFNTGSVALQELEWHFFALIFLLGAGYTFLHDGHVRVDIFYARLSGRWKRRIDLIGGIAFLLPTCVLVIWTSIHFVAASWRVLEGSGDPGGLPARYILKAAIPIGFFLLALQGFSRIGGFFVRRDGAKGGGGGDA